MKEITPARLAEAVGQALTPEQIYMVNAGVWGFMTAGLSGSAEEIFNRTDQLNGMDAWRRVARYIGHGR